MLCPCSPGQSPRSGPGVCESWQAVIHSTFPKSALFGRRSPALHETAADQQRQKLEVGVLVSCGHGCSSGLCQKGAEFMGTGPPTQRIELDAKAMRGLVQRLSPVLPSA